MQNLNVKLENLSSVTRKIRVEIPKEIVELEFKKAMEKFSKNVVLKGYRKGKAPKELIEKTYTATVKEDLAEQLISKAYIQVLGEHKIEPVNYPEISNVIFKDGEPFVFEAKVEVKPEFELKEYKGLNIETFPVEPSQDEVDKVVEGFLESKADMKTLDEDRPIVDGDWIDIDLEGYINGEKSKDLSIKSYICKVGDVNTLLEILSSGIKGMRVNEEREVKHTYPEDYYSEQFRGKEATFKVKLNRLMDRVIPELTDDFVQQEKLGASRQEFIDNITKNIKHRKEDARAGSIRRQIIDKLLEANSFDVPSSEIEAKLPEIQDRALQNMFGPSAGKLPEASRKEVLEKHKDEIQKAAEEDVRLSYLLGAISEKDNIKADEKEVNEELELVARSMSITADKLKNKYGAKHVERTVRKTIEERKTLDYLKEQAKIKETEPKKEN